MTTLSGYELSEYYVKSTELTATTADRHHLYQLSVQSPGSEVRFLYLMYQNLRNKRPKHMREDFCGTALITATWISMGPSLTAECFDNDPDPLQWGKKNNFDPLGDTASQATLHLADVRRPSIFPPHVRCAYNFSYWLFMEENELREYFKGCHDDLSGEGLLFLDVHGGYSESDLNVNKSETESGFTYVWDCSNHTFETSISHPKIHFKFKDGTELVNAFEYSWRVWKISELTQLLHEAGFASVSCYLEGSPQNQENNKVSDGYELAKNPSDELGSKTAYLIALK